MVLCERALGKQWVRFLELPGGAGGGGRSQGGGSQVQRLKKGTHRGQTVRVAVVSAITVYISRNLLETTVYLLSMGFRLKKNTHFFWLELHHNSAVEMQLAVLD